MAKKKSWAPVGGLVAIFAVPMALGYLIDWTRKRAEARGEAQPSVPVPTTATGRLDFAGAVFGRRR